MNQLAPVILSRAPALVVAAGPRASIASSNSSPRRSGTRTRAAPMRAPRRNSSIGLRRAASRSSPRSRACTSRPTSSGPRHIVRRGKTPVLDPAKARQLIDAIDTTTVIGLRDRALIGLLVYSFARIGAAIGMRVEDVYTQNRRLWVRLHEKGGKQRHAVPPQSRVLFARHANAPLPPR